LTIKEPPLKTNQLEQLWTESVKVIAEYIIGNPVASVVFDSPLPLPASFQSPKNLQITQNLIAQGGRHIRETVQGFDDLEYVIDALNKDLLSAAHLRNVFQIEETLKRPYSMVDQSLNADWHQVSTLVAFLIESLKLHNVSYVCENDGCLYIHLFPSSGEDDDALKSRKNLRGHTDGSVLPFSGNEGFDELPPGPDLVILIGLRNSTNVPTRVHPLSKIMRKLKPESIRALKEPVFVYEPQKTFKLPGIVKINQPVIQESDEGFLIRYSHSNVSYNGNRQEFSDALEDLKDCIVKTSTDITISSGDVLFINNRTAIHGRAKIADVSENPDRWLMRTYCHRDQNFTYKNDDKKPYALGTLSGT